MLYEVNLVVHVLSAVVAVGGVSVVDYLHVVGLRRKKLERTAVKIYPFISKLINLAFLAIILTGIGLIVQNPELLGREIFRMKMTLVILVGLNGIYLQRKVGPNLDKCVLKGTKYCSQDVLYHSVIAGSFSVVTWYSILILSLTKHLNYEWHQFLIGYLIVLVFACLFAFGMERRARKWR